jgi:phosphoribosylaminoimidazole-succinocarboxamide synthase
MIQAVTETKFQLANQKSLYKGKVRDVYNINDEYLVMVVSDRISAFDVVLPEGIPFKGQVLCISMLTMERWPAINKVPIYLLSKWSHVRCQGNRPD